MGQIALEPAPRTNIVVHEADGTLLPRGGGVINLYDAAPSGSFRRTSRLESDDGTATFFGDVPESLIVEVMTGDTSVQWITTQRDPETTVVTLAPWRDLEVRVTGAAARYPGSNMFLRIHPEGLTAPAWSSDPSRTRRPLSRDLLELEVPAGDPRLFQGRIGRGRLVIDGESPLFHVVARTVDVGSGDGPVRIELESTE
jgi:hypothetical protein